MKRSQTVMMVEREDDLDMAWAWIAKGWAGVKLMPLHHGHWSWLVWK